MPHRPLPRARVARPDLATLATLAALVCAPAWSQEYPNKPIRVINPFAAGGNLDIVARAMVQRMGDNMKQPFVVENRVGAGGALGSQAAKAAPADGYTIMVQSNTFLATPAVSKTAGYDPIKDFTCVSLFAMVPQILVVNPSVPVNSVNDLIALAKRDPGKLTYGSAGNGGVGHITAEMFASQAGIKLTHVPYKGNAPALTDVVGGQITFMFDTLSTSIQYVKSGRLKGLGVTGDKPSPIFPNLRPIAESALPGYEAVVYNVMVVPAATPAPIITRLFNEVSRAVNLPELKNNFIERGVELGGSASPAACNDFLKKESDKYQQIVRLANIKE